MNGSSSNTSGANVAAVDFTPQAGSDLVSNKVMEEVARRLNVTFEQAVSSDFIISATAPEDLTKIWFQIDPITNVLIGQAKIWDADAEEWVSPATQDVPYAPPQKYRTTFFSAAGASTSNVTLAGITTTDYDVTLTPTTQTVPGTWLPAPVTFPSHFGFVIIGRTETTLQVAVYGAPTGGIQWEVLIEERE